VLCVGIAAAPETTVAAEVSAAQAFATLAPWDTGRV
jgi:hypothetical protein